jgi:hypothetical protein
VVKIPGELGIVTITHNLPPQSYFFFILFFLHKTLIIHCKEHNQTARDRRHKETVTSKNKNERLARASSNLTSTRSQHYEKEPIQGRLWRQVTVRPSRTQTRLLAPQTSSKLASRSRVEPRARLAMFPSAPHSSFILQNRREQISLQVIIFSLLLLTFHQLSEDGVPLL